MSKKKFFYPLLFSILFFLFGFLTISHYGVNWDSSNHYTRGQALLRYVFTREKDYKNLDLDNLDNKETTRRSIYQATTRPAKYFLEKQYFAHPPLPDILASLSNSIFYQKLGILGDIESYHLFIIFVSSLLVFTVFFFTLQAYGFFAALVAYLSLVLYPLFLAESHFNIKDPIEASFYGLTIYAFYKGVIKDSWKWIIASAIFCGLALGTKLNVVFAPFIVIPWLIIYKWESIRSLKWPFSFKLTLSLIFYPLVVFAIFLASNPPLWPDPAVRTYEVFKWYQGIGGAGTRYQPDSFFINGFNTYPVLTVLFQTPLVILFLSFFGVIASVFLFKREKKKTSFLVLLWLAVPIIRVTLPGASIYGGVRQIMEYIPAMAILAGIGARYMATLLNGYIVKLLKKKPFNHLTIEPLKLLQIVIILMFLPITFKMIQIHPVENAYFNPLIGGLKGAKERNYPDWGVTLGNQYKQGAEWLNKHAEENAKLALLVSTRVNLPPYYLRDDIRFANNFWSRKERKGEYLMEAIYDGWIRVYYYAGEFADVFLKPVYELKVDDVAIFKIWKNDPEHTYPKYLNEKTMDSKRITLERQEDAIFIGMEETVELMEVIVDYTAQDCSPFEEGEVYLSLDGEDWESAREPIKEYMIEKGRLTYPLAAKKAKYVKIISNPENSCDFKIETVNIRHI